MEQKRHETSKKTSKNLAASNCQPEA